MIVRLLVTTQPRCVSPGAVPPATYNSARDMRHRSVVRSGTVSRTARAPAAHAGILGAGGAVARRGCGAPDQLGGRGGGGRTVKRDEANSQPRAGLTECHIDTADQAHSEPFTCRAAGSRRHDAELRRADPPERIGKTGPAAQPLAQAITDAPVVPQRLAVDLQDGGANGGAIANRRGEKLLGPTEQAALVPH